MDIDIENVIDLKAYHGVDGLTKLVWNNGDSSANYVIHGGKSIEHAHKNSDEVYCVFRGRGIVHIGKESKPVTFGDVIRIPRGTFHCFERTGDGTFEMIVLSRPPLNESDILYQP